MELSGTIDGGSRLGAPPGRLGGLLLWLKMGGVEEPQAACIKACVGVGSKALQGLNQAPHPSSNLLHPSSCPA